MKIVFIEPLGMLEETVQTACCILQTKGHTIRFHDNRTEDGETLVKRGFLKT